MEVSLSVSDDVTLDNRYSALIFSVIRQGLADEAVGVPEVSVKITTDEEIQGLNSKYRSIDKPTDVLSFPMHDNDCLGDIIISLPRAAAQAAEYGHTLRRELAFLTAHGLLHLLGYDHEASSQDEQEMIQKQDALLSKLNILR